MTCIQFFGLVVLIQHLITDTEKNLFHDMAENKLPTNFFPFLYNLAPFSIFVLSRGIDYTSYANDSICPHGGDLLELKILEVILLRAPYFMAY